MSQDAADIDSQSHSARDTKRLGATIDVEQSAVRFLGSLVLVGLTPLTLKGVELIARTYGTVVVRTLSQTIISLLRRILYSQMSPC